MTTGTRRYRFWFLKIALGLMAVVAGIGALAMTGFRNVLPGYVSACLCALVPWVAALWCQTAEDNAGLRWLNHPMLLLGATGVVVGEVWSVEVLVLFSYPLAVAGAWFLVDGSTDLRVSRIVRLMQGWERPK